MPEYKKTDNAKDVSPLKNIANLKGNIVGEINGIQVVFDKSCGITATKSYKNVDAVVTNSRHENEREEVLPSVKVTLNFAGAISKDKLVIRGGIGKAEFALEGKEHGVSYRIGTDPHARFQVGDKLLIFKFGYIGNEQPRLSEKFSFLVDEDFSRLKDGIARAIEKDKELVPFRLEIERRRFLTDMVTGLIAATMIIETKQRDVRQNPLALQEVHAVAKRLGLEERLVEELKTGIKSMSDILERKSDVVGMKKLALEHVVDRLERAADVLERMNKKPTKKDAKEAEENLAFEFSLRRVEEMLGKNPNWRLNPAEFASQVIEEVKSLQKPRRFAEMLKERMEYERKESIVHQVFASGLPQAPDAARIMGIYKKELEGDYMKEKAMEKRAGELILLGEEMLKVLDSQHKSL